MIPFTCLVCRREGFKAFDGAFDVCSQECADTFASNDPDRIAARRAEVQGKPAELDRMRVDVGEKYDALLEALAAEGSEAARLELLARKNKPGAGRPALPPEKKKHRRELWLTDADYTHVQDLVERLTGERPADRKTKEEAD